MPATPENIMKWERIQSLNLDSMLVLADKFVEFAQQNNIYYDRRSTLRVAIVRQPAWIFKTQMAKISREVLLGAV